MASNDDISDDESIDSALEWELDEGVPQVEDPFIQKYLQGRDALIEQEKKQRHDALFKQTMSPLAKQASKILASIRKREMRTVWTADLEESFAQQSAGNIYPGMMYTLARDRMEKTELYSIIRKMPKGALLHAHLDGMIDIDWLIEQALAEKGFCLQAAQPLDDQDKRQNTPLQIRFYSETEIEASRNSASIWSAGYVPDTPVAIREAQRTFPDNDTTFKKWMISRCTITADESIQQHLGLDAVWKKFQSTFRVIDWIFCYEPIFRRAIRRVLGQLAADGIMYADLRMAFGFGIEFRKAGQTKNSYNDYEALFRAFDEEIENFKKSDEGKAFRGARMIYTIVRIFDNRQIGESMMECIRLKKKFPQLISGFDFVGQEDKGRTLADLTPMIFWFRKKCMESGIELPFFFHAGECLGDGDSTDNNLFDAIILGTRRIGHGYSLYKHPLLMDMVKEKKILIESCPISNEVLRLSSSILSHSLPALLAKGIPVSLNNDDPAILGHGGNGLSQDFWQTCIAFENVGLEGLAAIAENSVKWCAIEDQKTPEWLKGISEAYMGKTMRAKLLKEWRSEFEKWCQWMIMEYPLEVDDESEDDEDEDENEEDEEDEEGEDESE